MIDLAQPQATLVPDLYVDVAGDSFQRVCD